MTTKRKWVLFLTFTDVMGVDEVRIPFSLDLTLPPKTSPGEMLGLSI